MSGVTPAELGGHAFLRGMADRHLATLSRACWVAPLRAGHRLFEEGGTAQRFWLLQGGHVALDLHSPGSSGLARQAAIALAVVLVGLILSLAFSRHRRRASVSSS